MSDEGTYTLCPRCGRKVGPNGEGLHFAVELQHMPAFGQTHDFVERMGGYVHENCPIPSGWRAKPKP